MTTGSSGPSIRREPSYPRTSSLHRRRRALDWLAVALLATCAQRTVVPAGEDPQNEPETHWSFLPINSPPLPDCQNSVWVRNPIDAFVRRSLQENGLSPAPPAGKLVLLRRASFDLRGLPPTPEETAAFLADDRADAFERLIERMLASAHYGERWGRHWLDVVRYSDSGGFEDDLRYAQAWQFRDYVIRSLNANKPFDRFIQEQVAGDELWPDDPDAVLGSALYCIGPVLTESAMVEGQIEYEWLTDAADTTGEAFLGLTLGCARCHDHKYDPIRQRDYYAMQAIFAASDRPYPEEVRIDRIKAINGLLSETPLPTELLNDPRCTIKIDDKTNPHLFQREKPLVVHRLHRGEVNKPQEIVQPALPAFLMPAGKKPDFDSLAAEKRRSALAHWLTSRTNPLVARVLVNRVWGWHFGQAIVRTPNDFGSQGEEPTHPELLDFLARDLMDHGWNLKRLHRLIMLSSSYQMSSVNDGSGKGKDSENGVLWRFPRRRLDGEEIRDAMLDCAGPLNPKQFGKPVVPQLGQDELTGLFDAKDKWPVTKEVSEHSRRSIYLLARRTFVYPLFSAFDPPGAMTSCARRMQTIVPTQALTLLNSPLARELATEFANRIIRETGHDREKNVRRAWLLAFGRHVTKEEAERAKKFLAGLTQAVSFARGRTDPARQKSTERYSNREPAPKRIHEAALAVLCLALFNSNEFVFLD